LGGVYVHTISESPPRTDAKSVGFQVIVADAGIETGFAGVDEDVPAVVEGR
jgi:hypothetical protein